MASNLSSKVTEGIRINVRTTYVRDESSPKHRYYVFAYQVEIINESAFHVKLMDREWHIINGFGEKRIVKGEGVVGKQPLIAPGSSYKYVSGSHFPSTVGKMFGSYYMKKLIDNSVFKVDIPPFVMTAPHIAN